MENPIYDMSKEENNEPKTFNGFVDSPVYGISKGESMDLVALGNFDMEEEHVVYPYDQFEPYIGINNEDKENLISELDIRDGESITFDIYGEDDYQTFIENPTYETFEFFFENPIYDMSSEESVYSETYGSCKEELSKFSCDQSKLYSSIFNEDLEKQYNEELDWVQLIEDFFSRRLHIQMFLMIWSRFGIKQRFISR